MAGPARHSLAWLSKAGWQALDTSHSEDEAQLAEQWQRMGWPAVVRRMDADAADTQVCLGIAAPPDRTEGIKKRFGFRVPADAIERIEAPLAVQDLAASMPPQWRPLLRKFCAQASDAGIVFRVYGSAAFTHLTGIPYLTARSDIDLLLQPTSIPMLLRGIELLGSHAAHLPLDGEIEFPGQQCVAWKEWRQAIADGGTTRVLVKDAREVRLARVDDLLAALEYAQ